jgi:hypothetical protein
MICFDPHDLDVLTRLKRCLQDRPLVVKGVAIVKPRELRGSLPITDDQLQASLGLLEAGGIIQRKDLDGGRYLWLSMAHHGA